MLPSNFLKVEETYLPGKLYLFHHSYSLIKVPKKEEKCSELCDVTFTNASKKYRHVREYHCEKSISCEDCGQKFAREEYLIRHRTNMHGQEIFVRYVGSNLIAKYS